MYFSILEIQFNSCLEKECAFLSLSTALRILASWLIRAEPMA